MKPKLTLTIIIALAFILGISALFVPSPTNMMPAALYTKTYLSITAVLCTLYLGGALFLIGGLSQFKSRLRVAYGLMCAGFIIFSIAQIQLPLVQYFDRYIGTWVRSGGELLLYLLAFGLTYAGVRAFAKIFAIRSVWMSWWFVMGGALVMGVLAYSLPHVPPVISPEKDFRGILALFGFGEWISISTFVLTLMAKRSANVIYTNALAWLTVERFIAMLLGIVYVATAAIWSDGAGFLVSGAVLAPYILGGLAFAKMAYSFNTLAAGGGAVPAGGDRYSFFGRPLQPTVEAQGANSVDIVMYAAQQASAPALINPILDEIRFVTARTGAERILSAADQQKLAEAYLRLESYLVESEPIRKFTKQGLRQQIAAKFHLNKVSDSQTFWNKLPAA